MSTVRKQPLRQCIGCGVMKEKREMFRILKTSDDAIVLDTTGKKNGRGAYICPNKECLLKVIKSNGLSKAFKMNVDKSVYDELTEEFNKNEAR